MNSNNYHRSEKLFFPRITVRQIRRAVVQMKQRAIKPDLDGNYIYHPLSGRWLEPYQNTWLGGTKPVGGS